MDSQAIQEIYLKYPWASEATMESIANYNPSSYNQAISTLRNLGVDVSPLKIKEAADNVKKEASKSLKITQSTAKTVTGVTRTFDRDLDPLQATVDLMELGTGVIDGFADQLQGLTGAIPLVGKGVELVTTGARVASAGVVAAMATLASVISEQEKQLRVMMDIGLVSNDLRGFDALKTNAAYVGMSFAELSSQVIEHKGMLANMGDGLYKTVRDMSETLVRVETDSKFLGDMGYNVEQLSARFLEEASLLYKFGEIQAIDASTQRRINDNLRASSAMATVMAQTTGESRTAMLESRQEALSDVSFRLALHQNESFIIDNFGEGTIEKIQDAQAIINTAFTSAIPELGPLIDGLLTDTVRDIRYDKTSVNNQSEQLRNVLSFLPGDVQSQFTSVFDRAATGDITQNELIAAVGVITQNIANATSPMSNSEDAELFRNIQASAVVSLDSIKNATVETLTTQVANAGTQTEAADDSVDAIDQARIAFRTSIDTMTPGFQASTTATDVFGTSIDALGSTISYLFPQMASYEDNLRKRQREEIQATEDDNTEDLNRPNPTGPNYQNYMSSGTGTSAHGIGEDLWKFTNPDYVAPPSDPNRALMHQLRQRRNNGTLTDVEQATLSELETQFPDSAISAGDPDFDFSNVHSSEANNPLYDADGASAMAKPDAVQNMQATLSGPYQEMQRMFGMPVTINDAIAKSGSSRETQTKGSQHFHGKALDLSIRGMNDAEKMRLFNSAMQAGFTGFGFGQNILHVDTRANPNSWVYSGARGQLWGGEELGTLQSRVANRSLSPVLPRSSSAESNAQLPPTNNGGTSRVAEDIASNGREAFNRARNINQALQSDQLAGGGGK